MVVLMTPVESTRRENAMSCTRLMHGLFFIFILLSASACSNRASTFVAAPEDADRGSVVYIYRPSSTTNFMMSPKVIIDGNEKFQIGSGEYRYVYLKAGDHVIGLNPTDQYFTDPAISLNVQSGNSYYLRVSTSLKFVPDSMNTRRFWMEVVDDTDALSEIADTGYAGPKTQTAVREAERDQGGDQFTVDKTQDPFAGKYE
jgi:hypothetical protein